MALTSDDRDRFLTSLRSDVAFREEIRREVLSAELLALPERFAAFVDEMHAFVDEMHAFVDEMHAFVAAANRRFDALDVDVGRLKDDSGQLKGMVLEIKIRGNPGYYLRHQARKVRLIDLDSLLDDAGIDDLSDGEYTTLARNDVLARGVSKQSGAPAVFVVETTWRPHTGDVDRLVIQRQILRNHDVQAVAVIASLEAATAEVQESADLHGIVIQPARTGEAA